MRPRSAPPASLEWDIYLGSAFRYLACRQGPADVASPQAKNRPPSPDTLDEPGGLSASVPRFLAAADPHLLGTWRRANWRPPDEKIVEPASYIVGPDVQNPKIGLTVSAYILVGRHFTDTEPSAHGLDNHLLLDCRNLRFQSQPPCHVRPNRPKSVLRVGQPHILTVVDTEGDDLAAEETHELIDGGMKLVAPPQHARTGHVIGLAVDNRLDERRNVPGIVGTVRVDKDENVAAGMGDANAQGVPLAFAIIEQHGRAQFGGDGARTVAAVAVNNQQFIGIRRGPLQHRANVARLIAAGHNHGDPHLAPIRPQAVDLCGPVGLGIPVGQIVCHISSRENG